MNEANEQNDGSEDGGAQAGAPPPPKGGGIMKGIVIVSTVVVIEVIVAFVVVTKFVLPSQGVAVGPPPPQEVKVQYINPGEPGVIYEIKDVIVNPAATQGTRFLSTTIGLETQDSELLEEMEAREPLIRDTLINILSSKRLEDLSGVGSKDSLRLEIIEQLNPQLAHGRISKVYFTNYVIQ